MGMAGELKVEGAGGVLLHQGLMLEENRKAAAARGRGPPDPTALPAGRSGGSSGRRHRRDQSHRPTVATSPRSRINPDLVMKSMASSIPA